MSWYKCDVIRKENKGLAKFSCDFLFFQIIEDTLSLQKNDAGYDAQRFHLILPEIPVIDESPYTRFVHVMSKYGDNKLRLTSFVAI